MIEILLIYIAIVITVLLVKVLSCKESSGETPDDPTGALKQEIFDKLDKAIKDIRSTIS